MVSRLGLKYKKFKKNNVYGHILQVPADPEHRKIARDDDKYNHMFGGAGVYLYVTEKKTGLKRPQIYAGKATHLDARANDHSRLESKDFLVLIKKGNDDTSVHMDENWRQQIEHRLIDELMKNQVRRGYDCLNKSYESKSLMDEKERKIVNSWFEELIKCLTEDFGLAYFKKNSSLGDKREVALEIAYNGKENFVSKDNPGHYYGTDLIKIPKKSFCRPATEDARYKFSIDIRYQNLKWELINTGVLKWIDQDGHYEFMEDMWFTSLTQMAAIVYNTQPGAKIWVVRKDSNEEWTPMNEHPIWVNKD